MLQISFYSSRSGFLIVTENPHDTGATHHLTNNWSLLHNSRHLSQPLEVRFGDNGMKVAIGKGEVHLSISNSKSISIPNVQE